MIITTFSQYLERLEKTTSRNEMVVILAELFKKADLSEIGYLVYLTQGRVVPLFEAVEFGIADKMMIRAIASAFDVTPAVVTEEFRRQGDLGKAAEKVKSQSFDSFDYAQDKFAQDKKSKVKSKEKLTIPDVYKVLYNIATTGGEGSQEGKIGLLAQLLKDADPLSVRYIVRIPLGKLRLGFSDMTVLDALSWMMTGTKEHRKEIERAYNVRPDLGFIASTIKEKGIKGLRHTIPKPGVPILMAKAERLSSGEEIIKQIGTCAVEPKIDGFRLQIHVWNDNIKLFTRNLEDATFMYPDVVAGVKRQVTAKTTIFEGEAVAYHIQTGEFLPFQETVQRKRKYNIAEKASEIPLKLICFDLLFKDGEEYLTQEYPKRRKVLLQTIKKGETLLVSEEHVVSDPKEIDRIFEDAISRGLEGVMAKRLAGEYQAGARSWNWIKYKRSYTGKLEDTIDAVVMGYDYGQGKRVGFGIGDFLIGIYDKVSDSFKTVAKIGTGLTDEEWKEMKKRCNDLKVAHKPARYDVDRMMEVNVWVEPKMVLVIRADEITRSSVHTAGRKLKPSKSGSAFDVDVAGYALRFPRLEQFRTDKSPEDATSTKEIEEMYKLQGKKK